MMSLYAENETMKRFSEKFLKIQKYCENVSIIDGIANKFLVLSIF